MMIELDVIKEMGHWVFKLFLLSILIITKHTLPLLIGQTLTIVQDLM